MSKPRGKALELVRAIGEVEGLVGKALGCVDTSEQYRIRAYIEEAIKRCQDTRDLFDPI
ncbi:hypothetical protein ACTHPH_21875 [Paenibacillus pasadenensis]